MIIVQIATIPERSGLIQRVINSLKNQVDEVKVVHNSTTDGMKFYNHGLRSPDDIIFICDDDIIYPSGYVSTMLTYLKPGIVITCMGKIMRPRPIESFYRDELIGYKTFETNDKMAQVEVPGTCAMAFHRSTCPDLDHTYFKSINSDIWMGIYCKENNIPCYVIPHKADWLTNLMPMLPLETPSVFDRFKNNDTHMTELINTRL